MYFKCQILSQYLPSTTLNTVPVTAVSMDSVPYDVEVVPWAAIFYFLCIVFSTITTAAVMLKIICHVVFQLDHVMFLSYLDIGFKFSDHLLCKIKRMSYKLRSLPCE